MGDTERKSVEDAVAALRDAAAGDDTGRIRQRLEALSQALTRGYASRRCGHEANSRRPGRASDKSSMGGDDVVDAEFEDVDEPRRHQG